MTARELTVVTPLYNARKFIERCLQTVIGQECPQAEHLVVDSSQDGTSDIVAAYARKYPHIRHLVLPGKGQAEAMNEGIRQARGTIIGFLNVDDRYEPGTLQRVLGVFKGLPELGFAAGNCLVWDPDGRPRHLNRPERLDVYSMLLPWYPSPVPENPSAYFYHKSLHEKAGLYDPGEDFVMDLEFLFRALPRAHTIYVDETWGHFCMHADCKTYRAIVDGTLMPKVERLRERVRLRLPFWTRARMYVHSRCLRPRNTQKKRMSA